MANVSYRRVSSVDQKTDRQLEGITFDESFEDKASAGTTNRPGLEACLKFLRKGDTLNVHSIDRLARNLMDLQKLVIDLTSRGVAVHFHKESLVFSGKKNPMNNLMLQMMGAFAEFEKALINERQREGIASAKAKGKHLGRAAKLTPQEVQTILPRLGCGESVITLAKEFKVSRQTVYQAVKRIDKLGNTYHIDCKICGEKVAFISHHLSESHNDLTIEDYRKSYPDAHLMSEQAQKILKNRINLPWAKTKVFVLNLEQIQDDFIGHYEMGNEFGKFRVMTDKKVILEPSPDKFKDFEFYAAIWGKFDPYTLFLRNPVEVDSITFENISAIKNIYDERMRG